MIHLIHPQTPVFFLFIVPLQTGVVNSPVSNGKETLPYEAPASAGPVSFAPGRIAA
jgi:hypothetical protein